MNRQAYLGQEPMHQHHNGAPRGQQNAYTQLSNPLPLNSNDFDRTFVPDGLVPGLRPQRSREPSIQLPPLNLVNTPGAGTPFGDDGREFFPQRLQHQGSWEQIPNRPTFSNNHSTGGQGQPQGLPRMSQLPPSAQQLNALRQSPNHLLQQQQQQLQMMRNARNQFDGPPFPGQQQFSGMGQGGGMNIGGQPFNGVPSGGMGGMGVSSRLQDNNPGQNFGLNGLPMNGMGGYDLAPRSQQAQNRMLMNNLLGGNGPNLRELDGVRSNQAGMPLYQSQSLPPLQHQQQHLLQPQLQPFPPGPNGSGMPYGGLPPLDGQHSHHHGSMRGAPNDYLPNQHQQFSGNRPYGGPNGNMGPPPQGQDLMALLMGRQSQYRGE